MVRLIAIILFITFLSGCTVVKPVDRAALEATNPSDTGTVISASSE